MNNTTTIAGMAGHITGLAALGAMTVYRNTDWQEVRATVVQALKIAIVLTLLAGRATRRFWDALPGWSEQLGHAWAALLVPMPAPAYCHPLAEIGADLESLSQRELMAMAGTRRRLPKRQLVAMVLGG